MLCFFISEFSMDTTHPYWLVSAKSFAMIFLMDFKGSGPHSFAFNGVIVGSKLLWIKPWPGMWIFHYLVFYSPNAPFCSFFQRARVDHFQGGWRECQWRWVQRRLGYARHSTNWWSLPGRLRDHYDPTMGPVWIQGPFVLFCNRPNRRWNPPCV